MSIDWRQRIGFLLPSANSVLERDTRVALPVGVSAHFSRMKLARDDAEGIKALIDHVPTAASDLADAGVDVIAFACTAGSLDGGTGYDERISRMITDLTGIVATTTSTAVVKAMRALGIRRLAVLTPYEEWLNAKVRVFLEQSGLTIVDMRGLALPEVRDLEGVSPAAIASEVTSMNLEGADGVFISCTGFRGMEAAGPLESTLGLPVVTSNQATIWHALELAGVDAPIEGYGRLLTSGVSSAAVPARS